MTGDAWESRATGRISRGNVRRIAYILDENCDFDRNGNQQMVLLEKLEDAKEIAEVRAIIQRHADYTKSERAAKVLKNWEQSLSKFVRVIPKDYKRILQTVKEMEASGLSGEDAMMAAFEVNAKDVSRVGGS